MNRMSKWIQERKAYSNPMFGAMLIMSGMIFPVFHTAAAIVEPVQPMAQTAEQVVDALNAVQAGATVDQAFGIQPVKIRDWGSEQVAIYETLFGAPYDYDDAIYVLDDETTILDEQSSVNGGLVTGIAFTIHYSLLTQYDYVNDAQLPDTEISLMLAADISILPFIGTIDAISGSANITGIVVQATRPDGGRNRMVIVLGKASQLTIDNLDNYYFNQIASVPQPTGELSDCEEAFADANAAYSLCSALAINDFNTCMDNVGSVYKWAVVGCGVLGIFTYIFTSAAGPAAVGAALKVGGACVVAATAAAAGASEVCENIYNGDVNACTIARGAARDAARAEFGADCPDIAE